MTALWAVLGIVVAIAGLVFWASRSGGDRASARAEAAKAGARAAAAEELLEMNREATAIEREVAGMADQKLDEELTRWSEKPPR